MLKQQVTFPQSYYNTLENENQNREWKVFFPTINYKAEENCNTTPKLNEMFIKKH